MRWTVHQLVSQTASILATLRIYRCARLLPVQKKKKKKKKKAAAMVKRKPEKWKEEEPFPPQIWPHSSLNSKTTTKKDPAKSQALPPKLGAKARRRQPGGHGHRTCGAGRCVKRPLITVPMMSSGGVRTAPRISVALAESARWAGRDGEDWRKAPAPPRSRGATATACRSDSGSQPGPRSAAEQRRRRGLLFDRCAPPPPPRKTIRVPCCHAIQLPVDMSRSPASVELNWSLDGPVRRRRRAGTPTQFHESASRAARARLPGRGRPIMSVGPSAPGRPGPSIAEKRAARAHCNRVSKNHFDCCWNLFAQEEEAIRPLKGVEADVVVCHTSAQAC